MKFQVIRENHGGDVWLFGESGGRVVLGVLTREAIEDDTDPPQTGLTQPQCLLIADANIDVLSAYLSKQIDGPLLVAAQRPERPRVTIRTGDLKAAGIRLSTRILSQPEMNWVDMRSGRPTT
jgi:hypothetical protein